MRLNVIPKNIILIRELSEVSKKWNEKFRLADASKEEFLKLPICRKVKDIIDVSSVNEYVKSKKATKV